VLIFGESGTGKELVARALYHHSRRADRPFLAINCAAIPEALLESELFGQEKGAFTGADRRRIGKFEQCDGGTLFLDEIGDMAPPLQAKMLHVLQDQRFERLGGQETVQTRVRVLAVTNQDLEQLVAEGRFRKDLYYRLKGATVRVPPLRDRPGDVAELAHYFLFRFNRELGRDLRGFAPAALEVLQAYPWPGNVRKLQAAIREALLHATGPTLLAEFLPEVIRAAEPAPAAPTTVAGTSLEGLIEDLIRQGVGDLHAKVLAAVERVLLPRVLRETHGHQALASERLGLNRATLRAKLRALGLAVGKVVTEESGGECLAVGGAATPPPAPGDLRHAPG
jgi:two-component system nitrogen regulation response regulator GlnG